MAGSWAGSSRALIRLSIPVRSAAVNFQLNGRAVLLCRSMKASRLADSWPVLAKSLGETTFFWIIEKKISGSARTPAQAYGS